MQTPASINVQDKAVVVVAGEEVAVAAAVTGMTTTIVSMATAVVVAEAAAAVTGITTSMTMSTLITKAGRHKAAADVAVTGSRTGSVPHSSLWATSSRLPCAARTARR
jgi:hypothetical protein